MREFIIPKSQPPKSARADAEQPMVVVPAEPAAEPAAGEAPEPPERPARPERPKRPAEEERPERASPPQAKGRPEGPERPAQPEGPERPPPRIAPRQRDFIVQYDGRFIGHYHTRRPLPPRIAFGHVAREMRARMPDFSPERLLLFRPVKLRIKSHRAAEVAAAGGAFVWFGGK